MNSRREDSATLPLKNNELARGINSFAVCLNMNSAVDYTRRGSFYPHDVALSIILLNVFDMDAPVIFI